MEFVNDLRITNDVYPELREVLSIYVKKVKKELAENLIGIYLVGSLACGDFDLDSDIDFLCISKGELMENNKKSLQKIQTEIHNINCYPAQHLEGSYMSIKDLNDYDTVGIKELFYFDNGSTKPELSIHDNKWHVRWVLRERGITLIGQHPKTILKPIPEEKLNEEIKQTMLQEINGFKNDIDQPLNFRNSRFGQSFYILTYCRMLHTLYTGEVHSKKICANWAKYFLNHKWKNLIEQAWEERKDVRFCIKIHQLADHSLLLNTFEFLTYTVQQIEKVEKLK